jgi:hypothetical protein
MLDSALRAHHIAQHAGVVAAAWQILSDDLAGVHLSVRDHFPRLAISVVLAVVRRAIWIVDRFEDVIWNGRRGDSNYGSHRQAAD